MKTLLSAFSRALPAAALLLLGAVAPALAQSPQDAALDRVYLEAEELLSDPQAGTYTARGGVRLRSGNRILHADELVYNTATERVIARGSVEIHERGAPAQFADEIELDDTMQEGVARGFSTLLENNGRAASAAALRRPDGTIEFTSAYYTACDLCEDGSSEPTWRLRAARVVRDSQSEMIYYRNVSLEILGQPILYSPVFAHPDPSVGRKSGLLLPSLDLSNRLGFSYQQPYFWAVGPSQDLIIAPRVMTKVRPLLELDWTRRFYSGRIDAQTSFTYERRFDRDGPFGEPELRGHLFTRGEFEITPEWRWGFGTQAITGGDLFLRRYGYQEHPDRFQSFFPSARRTLVNQAYSTGRSSWYYADVSAMNFNRLSETFDDDRLPIVAPFVRANAKLPVPEWAGVAEVNFNAVSLTRKIGEDYARASLGAEWDRPFIAPGGIRIQPFSMGRLDSFSFTETVQGATERTSFTRAVGAAGADVSWPFVRPGQTTNLVVAPRVFAMAATGIDDDEVPLLAESDVIDLDRSILFSRNRTAGFDLWEDGARVDAGLSLAARPAARGGLDIELFGGRSFRLDGDRRLPQGSGLNRDESDWVGELQVNFGDLRTSARTRLDGDTGRINRLDLTAAISSWRLDLSADYTVIKDQFARRPFEEIRSRGEFAITERWSATYRGRYDIEANNMRQIQAGLRYRDECTDFRIFYERENLNIGDLGPRESIKFELVLFTLGGIEAQ